MRPSLWQRLKYSPFFTQLVVIRRCNLDCGYCNEYDLVSDPVDKHILKERIDQLYNLGAFSICLTGGEPTLHPDLPEIIEYCRNKGFVSTSMISNGFFMTPSMIEKLNKAGLQELQISIDGVKSNETTKKVLNNLRKRLKSLREYAQFKTTISGVVGACPPEETYEVIQTAKDLNFTPRVLLVHGPDGQVKLNSDEMKLYYDLKNSLPKTWKDFSDYREELIKKGKAPFKCRAGSRYLYVDENGIVTWCSQTRDYWSKKLSDYTYQDLEEQFHTYKSCQDHCTLGCVRSASQIDGFRHQNHPEEKNFSV